MIRQEICDELRLLQRHRVSVLKTRIRLTNRLLHTTAVFLGFKYTDSEEGREKQMNEARKQISQIRKGKVDSELAGVVKATDISIDAYDELVTHTEKKMLELVRQFPEMSWVKHEDQKGFGELSLAILIGEMGDLSNYDSPTKVWRRMGLAPFEKDGKVLMGSTWKRGVEGKLTAEEWSEFGYSPRRRSISWQFGKNLIMLNKGPWRRMYDRIREETEVTKMDWSKGRRDAHAKVIVTKQLLKSLWMEWTGNSNRYGEVSRFSDFGVGLFSEKEELQLVG